MRKSQPVPGARIANVQNVVIPLLSDEELKARGIEKPKFPPFNTWSPEQQKAGRELSDIMMKVAIRQALQIMVVQLELMQADGYQNPDAEAEAARRGIESLDNGTWKPGRDEWGWLKREMRIMLETILQSVTQGPARAPRKRRRRRAKESPK
jgi:hypothetical protein